MNDNNDNLMINLFIKWHRKVGACAGVMSKDVGKQKTVVHSFVKPFQHKMGLKNNSKKSGIK